MFFVLPPYAIGTRFHNNDDDDGGDDDDDVDDDNNCCFSPNICEVVAAAIALRSLQLVCAGRWIAKVNVARFRVRRSRGIKNAGFRAPSEHLDTGSRTGQLLLTLIDQTVFGNISFHRIPDRVVRRFLFFPISSSSFSVSPSPRPSVHHPVSHRRSVLSCGPLVSRSVNSSPVPCGPSLAPEKYYPPTDHHVVIARRLLVR